MASEAPGWRMTTQVKRWRTSQRSSVETWQLKRLEVDFDEGEVVETWQRHVRSRGSDEEGRGGGELLAVAVRSRGSVRENDASVHGQSVNYDAQQGGSPAADTTLQHAAEWTPAQEDE